MKVQTFGSPADSARRAGATSPVVAKYEVRDLAKPLELGAVHVMGVPDSEFYVEDPALGLVDPVRVRVRHIDVPGQQSIRGAYLRTDRMEWILAIAEAERFDGLGAQRLFAAVRDQVLARHYHHEIEKLGRATELRPGGSTKGPAIRSYVPR